jgi:hypothetical protein
MLSDIQVTVHKVEAGAPEPIGFAVTTADGSFELVTNGAAGALWLPSGEYLCTLESAGAPVRIPRAYAKAETTPLKVTRTSGSDSLDLAIPEKLLP